ncbi:E3 ubiquitin-protein ligase RNF168 [Sarcophilus harrisii]|uniref:E3 ubiquitin-protein ligase RNF168 n=1 Tax=Sarcophilus harrisii TaxID=9305 RepID=UPI00062B89CB|nr:E3 ubiquitin-protein ligase RNF168 [Sarcophilus harrisii]
MASSPEAPLLLSDCLCPICMEILVEPVSLPCGHTLCHSCFQQTVQKASLYCPFCRRRVSSWARAQARHNTLINLELWRRIEKQYPRDGGLAGGGGWSRDKELEAELPPRRLSAPGELRREYEEELSKVKAERRACAEEEARISAEYINQLLAEEEEEERRREEEEEEEEEGGGGGGGGGRRQVLELAEKSNQEEEKAQRAKQEEAQIAEENGPQHEEDSRQTREVGERPRQEEETEEERQREREDQLKIDKDLAQEISISLKTLKCVLTSLFTTSSSYPAPCRSPKKTENKPNSAKNIHKSSLPKELGKAGGKRSYKSKEVSIGKGKRPRWQSGKGREMPTFSKQPFCKIENIGARVSLEDGGESKPGTSGEDKILNPLEVANLELPKTTFSCSEGAVAKPSGKSENECSAEMESEDNSLLGNKEIPGRKTLEYMPEFLSDSDFSSEKRKTCSETTSEKESRKNTFTQKLIDLEHLFFERHKQEEADRLFALQLQGEMNKEQEKLNRKKRTRDEYLLRPRVSLNPIKRRVYRKSLKKKIEAALSEPPRL